MTKLKHNQSYKVATFIAAVIVMLIGNTSVKGSAMLSLHITTLSKLQENKLSTGDTIGFVCPEDISTYTDLNSCAALVSSGLEIADPNNVISSISWIMEGATEGRSPSTGINQLSSFIFNEGTTIVTYQGKDRYNNSISCSFTITVVDNQVPTLENPLTNITAAAEIDDCGAEVFWEMPVVMDNCLSSNPISLSCSHVSGSWFDIGTTRVTYTSIEEVENSFSFSVTVVDNEVPVFEAPDKVVVDCEKPVPDAYVSLKEFASDGGQVSDNCEVKASSFSFINEKRTSAICPFTITRTYQIKDVHGNVAEVDHHIDVIVEEMLKSGKAELTASSGNWSLAATWGGTLPNSGDNVTIPSGVTVTVDMATAVCNNITIESGGTLIISGTNKLTVHGDWTNNGTFTPGSNGTVEFTGTSNAGIYGTTVFENLIVNKGSISTTLSINGNTSVSSGGILTMTSGLVSIPGSGSLALNFSSGLTIPAAAGFEVSGGTLNTGNFSITNNGLIQVSSGTANFGTHSGNTLHSQVDGAFVVLNGDVNIAGRLENTAGGTLTPPGVNSGISISGGTVTLATVGNGLSNTGSLNVSANGSFRFTGGTIVFQRPSTASTELDLGIVGGSGVKDLSGGTFQFGNGSTPSNSTFNISTQIALGSITSSSNADIVLESDLEITGTLLLHSNTSIELNGNTLRREISSTGTYTFPIADNSGNPVPVTVTLVSGTVGAGDYIEITTTNGTHPNNESDSHYLNQYWTVNLVGILGPLYNISANYQNSDVSGTESGIAMGVWTGSLPWTKFGAVTTGSNTLSATGITAPNVDFTGITLAPPTVNISNGASAAICNGNSQVLTAVASGDSPFSYSWSPTAGLSNPNIANPTLTPTADQRYTITVTDGNGFTAIDFIDVTVDPLPIASAGGSSTICSDGSATVSGASSANGIISWSHNGNGALSGATTLTPTYTASAADGGNTVTLTLTVTSNNACAPTTDVAAYTVVVNTLPTASISGTTVVCKNAAQPQAVFTGANGNASYTFTYSINGSGSYTVVSSGNTASVNVPTTTNGTFDYALISVEDANGCSQAQTGSATITVTLPISASAANVDPIVCFNGTGTVQITASGGTPPYTYSFDGKPNNSTGIFAGVPGSVAGTDYDWSVNDANGCATVSGTITIVEPPELIANAEVLTEIDCYAGTGTIRINASGGTSSLTYTLNGITNSTGVFSGMIDGTWAWSVDDANFCGPVTGNIAIVEPTEITVTSSVTTPIDCNGGTGTVTLVAIGGSGPYEYTFNGQTNTSGVFAGIYAGTNYSYSVVDNRNCGPKFGSITVAEPLELSADVVGNEMLCNGGVPSGEITVSNPSGGSGTYEVSIDNSNWYTVSTASPYTFTTLATGNYFVQIRDKDTQSCVETLPSVTITEPPVLKGSIKASEIACFGETSTVQISATGGTPGTPAYRYYIDGVEDTDGDGIFQLVGSEAGISYNWKVVDANACEEGGTITISQPPELEVTLVSVDDNEICENEDIILSVSAIRGTSPLQYNWTGPNGFARTNTQSPVLTNASTTAQGWYVVTVVDNNKCSKKDSVYVTVYASPTMSGTPQTQSVCDSSATTDILFSDADSYTWTNDETSIGLAASGTDNIPSFFAINETDEPITASIEVTPIANGCPGEPEVFTITVNPELELTITNNTPVFCLSYWTPSADVSITLNSNVSGSTYHWSYSDGSQGSGNVINETLSSSQTYTIYAEANGCYSDTLTTTVTVISDNIELETNSTGPNQTNFCPDETFSIEFYGSNWGSGSWYQNNGGGRRTYFEWETKFLYSVSNPNVVASATGGPIDDGSSSNPAELDFTVLNTTNEVQTAIVSITPWAYFRSQDCVRRNRPRRWVCDDWSDWVQYCAGEPYEVEITVQPFAIVCPSDIVTNTDVDDCFAQRSPGSPTTSCPTDATLSWDAINDGASDSGNDVLANYQFAPGTTTVTYTAEDNGEYRTCTFDVIVNDEQDPIINCPATDVTVYANSAQCGVNYDFSYVQATDNCAVDQFIQTEGPASGSLFPVGTTTLNFYADDESGNNTSCSFNVIVEDTISPTITCVGDQSVCAEPGMDYTNIGNAWDAIVSDNCSGVTVEYFFGGVTGTLIGNTLNNEVFSVAGSPHLITARASDAHGRTKTCDFWITINEKPTVSINEGNQSVCLNGVVAFTATSSGAPVPTFRWRKDGIPLDDDSNYSGTHTSTLNIIDLSDMQSGTYDVVASNVECGSATSPPVVLDVSSPPQITQQPSSQSDCRSETVLFRTEAAGGSGTYSYVWERKRPVDSGFTSLSTGTDISFPNPGELLINRVGNGRSRNGTEYIVIVTDDCGISDTSDVAVLTVNFIDSIAIVHETICQGEGTSFTITTTGSTPIEYLWQKYDDDGSRWRRVDNGGAYSGARTATLTINNATPDEAGRYRARATFDITVPNNNNATTCNEIDGTVVAELVVDPGPQIIATATPSSICPGENVEIKIYDVNGASGVTYSWTRTNESVLQGTFTESSLADTLFLSGTVTSASPNTLLNTLFNITGSTVNGCESSVQLSVTVGDETVPTAICQDIVIQLDAAGNASIAEDAVDNGSTDACGTLTFDADITTFDCSMLGSNPVVLTVTDANGNSETCTANVTVEDNIDPTAVCQNIEVELDAAGIATITAADIDNGSSDNCGTPILSIDITSFDCNDLGLNNIKLLATDAAGNKDSCIAVVTVKDDVNSVAITATVAQLDTLCLDDATDVKISITGGVGTIEYTLGTETNTSGEFTVAAGYNYAWSVTNTLGCGTTSGNFFVEMYQPAETPVFTGAGATTLCQNAANETYTATATNSIGISYSVDPLSAGSINSATGEMDWDENFSGQATITATATGHCNTTSADLLVDITPTVGTPTAITVGAGTEPTCQLTNGTTTTTYATTATNNAGFNWSLSNAAAGSIDAASGLITWNDGFAGTVDIQVTADGCNGPSAQVVRTVTITPTVGTPSVPSPADSTICQGSGPTSFTTLATDATDYNWTVTGAGNTISGTGTTATVTWDPTFSGVATVSVSANGCNGPSVVSSTTVTVLPTPVVSISADVSVCQNTSPDPEVIFTNPQSLPVTLTYNIDGGASQTIDIAANSTVSFNNSTVNVDNFIYTAESVRYEAEPACSNPLSGSATITIRPEAPVAPVAISGSNYVLPAASETYTIDAVANATNYEWSVPSGWTINSGQGTTSITLTTGIAGEDGDITVIAQNDCGDSPAMDLAVSINSNLAIVLQPQNQSDCFDNTVLFSVSISGGADPIVYTWEMMRPTESWIPASGEPGISFPSDGEMLVSNIGNTSNPDGTQYRVRITDNAGSDLLSDAATLTVNEILSMSPVDLVTTICEGESASFGSTTGGETPISMVWEKDGIPVADDTVISGSATSNISFTNARPSDDGEYRLTVTFPMTQPNDDSGNPDNCVLTSTIYRTLEVNPLPVLSGQTEMCVGQTIYWTPGTGGTWSTSDPAIATIDDAGEVVGIAEGTVTFTFTLTATGCSATTETVIVHPLPSATAGGSEIICSDGSVTVSGASAANGVVYWIHDGVGTLSDSTSLTPTYTAADGDADKTVTLILNVEGDMHCVPSTDTANFTVNVLPEAQVNQPDSQVVCTDESTALINFTTLNTTGTTTYSWTNSETSIGLLASGTGNIIAPFTPVNTGTEPLKAVIVVTPTISSGGTTCIGPSKTFTIMVNPQPEVTAPVGLTYCNGVLSDSIALNGIPLGVIYDISGGSGIGLNDVSGVSAIPSFVASEGSATLTVTPRYGDCSGFPVSFNVTVRPTPVVEFSGGDTVCQNSAPPSISITNPMDLTVVVNYLINGTTLQNVNIPRRSNVSIPVSTNNAGVFVYQLQSVQYLDSDPPVCINDTISGTATIEVIALPEPTITGPTDICADSTEYTYSTEGGMNNYTWVVASEGSIVSGGTSNDSNVTVIWNSGGSHNVSVRYSNAYGCWAASSTVFPVNVFSLPTPTITGSPNACLNATHIYSTQPDMVNYEWDFSSGASVVSGGGTNDNSITIEWIATDAQSISVNYTSTDGCKAFSPSVKNINVNSLPEPTITGDSVACAGTGEHTYTTETGMSTYVWTISAGGTVTSGGGSNSNTATIQWNSDGPQTVSVSYIDPATTCEPENPTVFSVLVDPMPVPTISGLIDVCVESIGNVYKTDAGMTSYDWTISAGGTITAGGDGIDSVVVSWTTPGTQSVQINYENVNGCSAATASTQNIRVHGLPSPLIQGDTATCLSSTETYQTVSGMTNYIWIIPAEATLVSGGTSTDREVNLSWNTTGVHTIGLNYTNANGCEALSPEEIQVTVYDLPTPTITGDADACSGGAETTYNTEPGMTAYIWSVSGGTITGGGSGTDSLLVVWNTSGPQTVTVNYYNANNCEALVPGEYTVNVVEPNPPTCLANMETCSNDAAFVLSGATPTGGTYSGNGVTFTGGHYEFAPVAAGPGVHNIAYTLPNICADQCVFTITVIETPVISDTSINICSGEPVNVQLSSNIPGTTFTWTSTAHSDISGNTVCTGSCGTLIADSLFNSSEFGPSSTGYSRTATYTVTADNNGCTYDFTVDVTVEPSLTAFDLTWNSNFKEDFIEVCTGAEALSDNDLEVLWPGTETLVRQSDLSGWNPTVFYSTSPSGPWIEDTEGALRSGTSYYEWLVDLSVNSQLGYHYFVLRINRNGCENYSNPAILNVVSNLTVEAGNPEYLCGGSTVQLEGAYVGGYTGSTVVGYWSIESLDPDNGSNRGTLSSTSSTANPANVTYTPPSGYVGEVTLVLTTDAAESGCDDIQDYRSINVVPPSSFNSCLQLANWTFDDSNNANGTDGAEVDDSEEPCLVTLVGSDNQSFSGGWADLTRCTGSGAVSFDWTFLAPANEIVWHQEDQKESVGSSSVSAPDNIEAGDLIIVTVHTNNTTSVGGSGFTLIESTSLSQNGVSVTLATFYKIAGASEPNSYSFSGVGNDDKIMATRVTGHDPINPIGSSSENTEYFGSHSGEEGYRNISVPGISASLGATVVAALAVNIKEDDYNSNRDELEFANAPLGMTTVYYNDEVAAARVATKNVSGSTGSQTFQWPSYNTRNRNDMSAAAQLFVINRLNNEEDAGYFLLNGTPTLLGNSNKASGSRSINVNSGDVFGFRVGTNLNTGGPGELIIYNLEVPNDIPIVTGSDSIFVADCQDETFEPTFEDLTIVDTCDSPVLSSDSLGTIEIDGCRRLQSYIRVYVDDCGAESEPFTQTVVWQVAEPIEIACPEDPLLDACTHEDTISTRYSQWVAGFTANGGCILTSNIYEVPPLVLSNIACGDTLSFTFVVSDGCGQDTSCTSTFTIQPLDTLIVYAPNDTVLVGCTNPEDIRVAYTNWLAAFYYDGGCASVITNIADTMPLPADPSCGVMLEFTYVVSNECGQFESRYASFTVEEPEPIVINVPAGVSLPLCTNSNDIEAAYTAWRDSFYHTGGCNLITNFDSIPELGDLSCGGTLNFTYRVQNANSVCADVHEETSFFSVAEAPNLILNCPADTTIPGCLGIQAITDSYDVWVDGFRATGGCAITTNIDSIPPLGGLICNGAITFTFVVGNDSTLCTAKDSCTSTFTIGAPPEIIIVTPPDTIVTGCNTDSTVIDLFNTWKSRFDYTGGCEGYVSASDISVYDLPSSCGSSVTVYYSVWDDCSQLVTDSATFTLNPELPLVFAPSNEVQDACQTQAEIDSAFVLWKAGFTFSGGCDVVGTDLSAIEAPNACGGDIAVTYSVADGCGYTDTRSAIFTINLPSSVLQEPTFDVPDDITLYRNDTCGYNADTLITGVPYNITDNCTAAGNLTTVYLDSVAAGSCPSEIIIYRKWSVLDNCLNETSQIQIITVTDTTAPVVVCAGDVSAIADAANCETANVELGNTTADDNCSLASFVGIRSDGLLITDPFPVGETTITWTATDACGNVSACEQLVTIVDNEAPTVVCPQGVDQEADPGECYRENVTIIDPTIDDNCLLDAVTWRLSGATTGSSPATGLNNVSGETFNVGVTTVTYYAYDISRNVDSCSFTVTIRDITDPVITANCADVTENAAPDRCSKEPDNLLDPAYNDNCWHVDSLTVRWEMTGATTGAGVGFVTDSTFNVGVTYVTYYVSDPDGNEAECSFTVTIVDVTPPVIDINSCTPVSETASLDSCSKVPANLPIPDYYDTCWDKDSLVLTYNITGITAGSGTGLVSGVSFNVGVSTVTYTVTDPDGNADDCSFTVTIIDVTPPVINIDDCDDASDFAEADSCSKIPATIIDPDYDDTCWPKDSLVLSYDITGATVDSGLGSVIGLRFNVGVSTVTYTVTDPDGNTDDCSFDVTIFDVTPPSVGIEGCESVIDTTEAGDCEYSPLSINDPIYSDDCWHPDSLTISWVMTGATTRNGLGSVKGESFNVGITNVTYTVSDPDNNEASCSFTVTIFPFNMPAFTTGCPPDVTDINDPTLCGADLNIPVPTVNDPCLIGYTITNDRTFSDNASGYYPVDTTYVVWTIKPTIGDSTSCTQMVIVTDVEDPIITTCPIDKTDEGCDTTVVLTPVFSSTTAASSYAEFSGGTNLGVGTDNCGIVTVTYIDVAAGTCPLEITRTWTVYDAAGNSATCDQTIIIGETVPPVVDCPPNMETPSVFDSTYAAYTIPTFSISDNCTDSANIAITWTITGTTNDAGTGLIPSPYQFNQGLSTVTYTFTDACGNETICSFTVNVLYPPEITCLPPDTLDTDPGVCYNHIEGGDIDNPGVPSNTTGEVLDWTWTVYAPDGTTVLGTGTSTGVSPDQVGPVDFPVGTSTIHWYAENLSGHDECDQLITVEDNEPPIFTANDFEDCVESLYHALYTGDVDAIDYNPDYPVGDYKLMEIGDTYLDIDLSSYVDNCCILTDGYTMHWEIDFEGNDASEPSIVGTGQPSTYINGVTGFAQDIFLWGDGVTFLSRTHTISYWITDCNGNESAEVTADIIINPRPELIKITN